MNIKILFILLLGSFLLSCGKAQYTMSEHIQRAKTYSEKGEIKAAIIEYKNALRLKPENAPARLSLGKLYLKIEDGSSAEKEFKKADKYGIDLKQHTDILASALLLQQKIKEIMKLQEPVTDSSSNKANFHIIKAEAYLVLNKPDLVKSELTLAEKIDPTNTGLLITKAKLAMYHSKYDLAKSYLAQSPQDDISSLFLTGKILAAQRKYDEAADTFKKVLDITEKNIVTRNMMESHLSLFYIYLDKKDYNNAIKHIKMLEKISPKFFIIKYLHANLAYMQGKYAEANDFLLDLIKINPGFNPAYLLLGATNYAMGYYNQAEMYLKKSIANNPGDITAHKILGATQMKLGNAADALTNFKLSYELNPDDSKLLALAGEAAIRNGNLSIGRSYLQQALESGLQNEQIKTSIAASYFFEGDYDKAITNLKNINTDKLTQTNLLLINAYIKKGDYASALRTLRKIAKSNPNSAEVNAVFGVIHFKKGDNDLAEKYLQKAINIDPNNLVAVYTLAELNLNNKNYSKASVFLTKALSINNNFLPALIRTAQLASMNKENDTVSDFLNRAIKLAPSQAYPKIMLAQHYLSLHKPDRALVIASDLEKTNPSDPQVLALLADIHMANNNPEKALDNYQTLLAVNKDSPELFVKIAKIYLVLKDYTHARRALDSALKLRKEYYPALVTLAFIEQHESNPGAALQLANQIIKQNPKMPNGYMLKGDLLMQQGKPEAALKSYKSANKYNPSGPLVIRQYRAMKKSGRIRRAERILISWLNNHPEDDRVRLILASSFQQDNHNDKAVKEYELILQRHPDNIIVLNNIALAYHNVNDSRAIDYAQKAYSLNPESPQIADTFGWLLVQKDEPKRGLTYLDRALKMEPDNRSIKFHIASAYVRLGKTRKAKQLLSDILSTDKPFEDRKAAELLNKKL